MKSTGKTFPDQSAIIVRIICVCILLQMWLTHALWWSVDRSFPTLPAVSFLPVINNFWSSEVMPWLLVFALVLVLIFPQRRIFLVLVIVLLSFLIVLDINRLQVWLYQWLCMLLVIASPSCLVSSAKNEAWDKKMTILQFMLIALYFWSGFNKLNYPFINHSFPWLMDAFEITYSLGRYSILAIATALFEILIGIGLLYAKTRKIACVMALGMHLGILLILGPSGHNWNYPVWPWNIAMMALVCLLFFNRSFGGFKSFWKSGYLAKIFFLLWGILPFGNTLEIWDEQLSFKMYSGTNPEGILKDRSIAKNCFPDSLKVYYTRNPNEEAEMILIDEWALAEMKVPPYTSDRTLRQIGRQWCSCLENPDKGSLEVLKVWRWKQEERPHKVFVCKELLDEL